MQQHTTRQRVAVIGTGAIGGFYGLMLARAGHEVHFLLRSDHEYAQREGLVLKSQKFGDFHLQPVNAYRKAADMPRCDWVLVAAKTTSNESIAPLLAQVVAPGARVLLLQNGLGGEDVMRRHLPNDVHLLGGLCMVSVHRLRQGVIEHFGLGGINLGYHSGPATGETDQSAVVEAVCQVFRSSGLDAPLMPDLLQARWQKLVFNIPFNGVSVLLNSGTQKLVTHPQGRDLIRDLMAEVIAGSAACGHPQPEGFLEVAIKANDGQPDFIPSMLSDFRGQRALELNAIYAEPLAAAARAGCPMKKVEMLYQTLCFLDERSRSVATFAAA